MTTIGIVDSGMGNFHSVARALRAAAPEAAIRICGHPSDLDLADRVVLPGQGAMPDCMRQLHDTGLTPAVCRAARNKPMLGVCVGEQMLFEHSAEGDTDCLGIFPGRVLRFAGPQYAGPESAPGGGERLKVPHMGWSRVRQTRAHPVWAGIPDDSHFYFVHSYFVALEESSDLVAGMTHYGRGFASAVAADNIFAVQFHPEKSAAHGLRLYRNFVNWKP